MTNMPPTQQRIPLMSLPPGTVVKVRSTRFPAIMHWGVVGYGHDRHGYPVVWHSQKSDTLRCTDWWAFSAGQSCEVERFVTPQQAQLIIQRLRSRQGLHWHLTAANCEMIVRWAVENNFVSYQLNFGVLALLAAGALYAIRST